MGEDRDTAQDVKQAAGRDELIAELQDQVRFLREELARKDAILLNMTQSMRQLTAPSEPPPASHEPAEAPQTATEQPGRVEPQRSVEAADEAERAGREPSESAMGGGRIHRSWWSRMFGG